MVVWNDQDTDTKLQVYYYCFQISDCLLVKILTQAPKHTSSEINEITNRLIKCDYTLISKYVDDHGNMRKFNQYGYYDPT